MLNGIDISNHQGLPATYRSAAWYQEAQFVIVQAVDPPSPPWPPGVTVEQLRAAQADGKHVGVYVWLWNSGNHVADLASKLALIPGDVKLNMRLWLDVEDTTTPFDQERCLEALDLCDGWADVAGIPMTGIYTGDWYINGYMNGWFPPDRKYWQANYSLTQAEAKQAVLLARPMIQYGAQPVDMDVMHESELVNVQPERTVADVLQALSYIDHDVLKPLRSYKLAKVVKAVAEIDRVAKQYGAA